MNIELKEYPVINQLVIVGEKTKRYKEQIIKILKLKEKKSFVKSFLAKDIENIKKLYASIGYNASKVETKIREIDNDNIDLLIEIDRGLKTKSSKIGFIGNKSVRGRD